MHDARKNHKKNNKTLNRNRGISLVCLFFPSSKRHAVRKHVYVGNDAYVYREQQHAAAKRTAKTGVNLSTSTPRCQPKKRSGGHARHYFATPPLLHRSAIAGALHAAHDSIFKVIHPTTHQKVTLQCNAFQESKVTAALSLTTQVHGR